MKTKRVKAKYPKSLKEIYLLKPFSVYHYLNDSPDWIKIKVFTIKKKK